MQTVRLLHFSPARYAAEVNATAIAFQAPIATSTRLPGRRRHAFLWLALAGVAAADPVPEPGAVSWRTSAEARFRYELRDEPGASGPAERVLTRGVIGGELGAASGVRAYGEVASGDVSAGRTGAAPNQRNALSLQQLWLEVPVPVATGHVTARLGRQEFDDGPRQLISVSDGPNLHRTWNGLRLAIGEPGLKLGAFAFRATQPGRHGFDERVSRTERLAGMTAAFTFPHAGGSLDVDPFWFRTQKPGATRDTLGARVSGRRGGLVFDWCAAAQSGHTADRDVDAWAIFGSQSLELSDRGWKPRAGVRLDVASGEGADRARTSGRFDPLYASSSYLGEGLFLSASNLLMVSPGVSFSPTARVKLAMDCGFVQRLDVHDSAFAGQLRAYPGTNAVDGRAIGRLLRVACQWSVSPRMTVGFDCEHLARGEVLRRAGLGSRSYAHGSVSLRY